MRSQWRPLIVALIGPELDLLFEIGLRRLERREPRVERAILFLEPGAIGVLARLDIFELFEERCFAAVERFGDAVDHPVGSDRLVADRVERKGDAGVARCGPPAVSAWIEQRLDRAGVGRKHLRQLGFIDREQAVLGRRNADIGQLVLLNPRLV